MILVLKDENGKDFEDNIVEVPDDIMLQCFCAASEENITFSKWFNKMLKNYIKKVKINGN